MHVIKMVRYWPIYVCMHVCVYVCACVERERDRNKKIGREIQRQREDPNSKNMYKLFSNL